MSGLRVALVGAGAIAASHAKAIVDSPRARLVAVCDPLLDRARSLACTETQTFASVDAMLAACSIDAAVIATPPHSHREIAERLANAGVHVLCEKPFAISVKDARAMIRTARRNGTLLTMAAKFRFVDDIRQARSAIDGGAVGELRLLENSFTAAVSMAQRWNSVPAISGGGVIIDNGTHSVDLFRYLAGPLRSVRAVEYARYQQLDVEDTAQLVARTAGGAVAVSQLSWTIDKQDPYYTRVHGSEGTIEIGWRESRVRTANSPQWTPFGSGYSKVAAFAGILANFVAAIAGEEPLEVSPADALGSVQAIEAAYRAMSRPGWKAVAA